MRLSKFTRAASAALIGLVTLTSIHSSQCSGQTLYSVTNLGNLPSESNFSLASSMNASGQVVGQSTGVSTQRPFLWNPSTPNGTSGSMTDLGALPGGNFANAQGINASGQVAGYSDTSSSDSHAFVWKPTAPNGATGSMVDLGTIGADTISNAQAINASGEVVGQSQASSSNGSNSKAFLWKPTTPNGTSGTMVNPGSLPSVPDARANAINASGQVAGTSGMSTSPTAILWKPTTPNGTTGSMVNLGTLPGGTSSEAWGINSAGKVIGFSDTASGTRAFLWTPTTPNATTGSMTDLGDLPGGSDYSKAFGINDLGQVVGESVGATGGAHGFRWSQSDGMLDLNGMLDVTGAGWVLGDAVAINDLGQIAGYGLYDPDGPGGVPASTTAYLLTPVPEPHELTLLLAAFALAIIYRRGSGRRAGTTALIGFVSAGLVPSPAHAGPGDIYNLGTLPAGNSSYGGGVNSSGQVAGYGYADGTGITDHAFRYDGIPGSGGVMHDLGTLGGTDSYATGINVSGQVVGYSLPIDAAYHAFRYDGTPGAGGVMRDLGTLPGGEEDVSGASGINASGQVAGWSYINEGTEHAFRYDGTPGSGGIMRDLGTLSGSDSFGAAINDSAQIAGTATTDQNLNPDFLPQRHAFRYDGTPGSGGVMRDLGTLGGINSEAYEIDNSGQVVGDAETADGLTHAFRYDGTPGSGGTMIDLDPDESESHALGINDRGFVVGYNGLGALLWTPDLTMIDLNGWLASVNPAATQFYLDSATSISNTGWITGTAEYNDGVIQGDRAFLLNASSLLPEPAGFSMLGLGVLALLGRRARRVGDEL